MFYEHQKPLANKISRRKPVDKSDQRRRLGLRPAGVWSPLLAASALGGPGDRGARCRPLREAGAATAWALGQNQTANTAAQHAPAGAGAQRGRGCHRPRRGCRRAWRALHSVTAAQSRQSCALLAAESRTMQDSNDVWSEQGPEIPTFCPRVQPLAGGRLPRGRSPQSSGRGKPRCLPARPRGPSSQCPPPPSPSRGAGTRRRRGGARDGGAGSGCPASSQRAASRCPGPRDQPTFTHCIVRPEFSLGLLGS